MSVPYYINLVTNNASGARIYLAKYNHLDIACVYCKQYYRYFSHHSLTIVSENTLLCNECNVDAMIPVTPNSYLYKLDSDERTLAIEKWHNQWFSDTTCCDSDQEYKDFEYDDQYDNEETKEPPGMDH